MEENVIFRYKNGHIIPIKAKKDKTSNEYMNEKIRESVIRVNATEPKYTRYDDDEQAFIENNPDVVLKESNEITDQWTSDEGGYHTNSGIMTYMTENRELFPHTGWEQGIKDIDNEIKGTLSEPITTYRTVQIPVKNLEVGMPVDEKGFIATSIDRGTSVASFNHGDARSSTIEVEVEAGTRCLYIGDKTKHVDQKTGKIKNEYELLFPEEYYIQITSKEAEYDSDGDYSRTIFKGKMIKK